MNTVQLVGMSAQNINLGLGGVGVYNSPLRIIWNTNSTNLINNSKTKSFSQAKAS